MLPPEIIDHVLSFLQLDHTTLKACAQAHPILANLVPRHLYSHITVQVDNLMTRNPGSYLPSELSKLIDDNLNIAKYVRSFRILLHLSTWRRLVGAAHIFRQLARILPLLTKLQALFLSSGRQEPVGWCDVPEVFRTAVVECLRLPTLTEVEISNVGGFPLSILDHSSSLERLSMSGDFFIPSSASRFQVVRPLNSLVLYDCSPMEIITSWAKTRTLRSLNFAGRFTTLSPFLEVCADSLTTLKIHVPNTFSSLSTVFVPIPLSLSCLLHLERLMVRSSISFTQQFWINSTSDESLEIRRSYSCLRAIIRLLDTLPSPPTKLALLLISIDLKLDNSFTISETDWSPLLSFPYFDVIPSIELRVSARKKGKQMHPFEILDILKQDVHLKQLESHPSFVINAVEDFDW